METFSSVLIFGGILFLLAGFGSFADTRKPDKRFKNGYKNNEELDPEAPKRGMIFLTVGMLALGLNWLISPSKPSQTEVAQSEATKPTSKRQPNKSSKNLSSKNSIHLNQDHWVYQKKTANISVAGIQNNEYKLFFTCAKNIKLTSLVLVTPSPLGEELKKQEVSFGGNRSIASTELQYEYKSPRIIVLDKTNLKDALLSHNILMDLKITTVIGDKEFRFPLDGAPNSIKKVLKDCNGEW